MWLGEISWTREGKKSRERPKSTRRRTAEEELKDLGHSWDTIERLAKDRTAWTNFDAALNADRRKGSK